MLGQHAGPADLFAVGRLVAVNVGLPRDVSWRGRTVHTGVWKQPVDGPQQVRTRNIDGDGQGDLAGHGGPHRAVLVYQLDSYEHWSEHFGRDDLAAGNFGENFTVQGLPDDEVCIGDRYRIGGALFEVSQPRVTCYRVGLRLDEPQLPALLVAHRRPGFYLRVLQEGVVRAGDQITRVRRDPDGMTVADVDALLYLPGHDRGAVARALRITALSPGWQQSFTAMLAADPDATGNVGLTDSAVAPKPAWPGFRSLQVVGVDRESDTVVSLRLASPDGQPLPAALPGQFVALRLAADGSPLTRSYSLSLASGGSAYRVSVKRETHGLASAFVHTKVRVGTDIDVAAPRGNFVLRPGDGPVLLLSAGIGATPVLAMLHTLADAQSTRSVWWLHGARNSAEHPFAAEVRSTMAQLPNATAVICYSAPLPADRFGIDYTHLGRLDGDLLRQLSPAHDAGLAPDDRTVSAVPEPATSTGQRVPLPLNADAYICGPQGFMTDIRSALESLGMRSGRISTEIFGAGPASTPGIAAGPVVPPHQPAGEPGSGPAITFARSGLTVAWRGDVSNVLELAEACDVPTRWSCRTGICHTCEVGLLSGEVSYDPAPIDPPAEGNVLVCCAAPLSEAVIDL